MPNRDCESTDVSSAFPKRGLAIFNFKIKAEALKVASIISLCSNADQSPFILLSIFLVLIVTFRRKTYINACPFKLHLPFDFRSFAV